MLVSGPFYSTQCCAGNLPCEVAASVKSIAEVLELTLVAWKAIPVKVFQASWIVTGYFGPEHFASLPDVHPVVDLSDAHNVLDPGNVLSGCSLMATPQYCTRFEWQIQDYVGGLCYSSLVPFPSRIHCLTAPISYPLED